MLARAVCRPARRSLTWTHHATAAVRAATLSCRSRHTSKDLSGDGSVTTLDHSVVHDHLERIASTQSDISLRDIEACCPPNHSHPQSTAYAAEHQSLLANLLRRFSAKQLRHFALNIYKLPVSKSGNKIKYARAIVETQWGWPSVSKIEREKRLWTVHSSLEVPITGREFFFALGKDGAGLRALSQEFDVHISPLTDSASRIRGLLLEGVQGSIDNVIKRLKILKGDITEMDFHLPMELPLSATLVLKISRLSGAMIETSESSAFRIAYRRSSPTSASVAKRLAIRAVAKSRWHSKLLTHIPAKDAKSVPLPQLLFPDNYSLYPFVTTHPTNWTLAGSSFFRIRRVGEWDGTRTLENVLLSGGLSQGRGRFFDSTREDCSLKRALLQDTGNDGSIGLERKVTSIFGHYLVRSQPGRKSGIIPPLAGSMPLPKILSWVGQGSNRRTFVPRSLESPPKNEKLLHRLEYCLIDPKMSSPTIPGIVRLEMTSSNSNSLPEKSHSRLQEQSEVSLDHRIWLGSEDGIDLAMPDRPMDMRLVLSNGRPVGINDCPPDFRNYIEQLKSHLLTETPEKSPDPPLTVEFSGMSYFLYSHSSVRQSECCSMNGIDGSEIRLVNESLFDLDSEQKSSTSMVQFDQISSDSEWSAFLRKCDWLSSSHELDGNLGFDRAGILS